jgi:hypothetical protein
VRDGMPGTDPPLCRPHQVLLQDVAMREQQRPLKAVEVLGDFLSGKRVTRDRVQEAAQELFGRYGAGGMAEGYYPGGSGVQIDWSWLNPGVQQQQQQRARQPTADEIAAQQVAARRQARVVLGYAVSQPVTEQEVQRRRRELARRYHPDRGGNPEKMVEVNAAADILLAELQGDGT